MTESVEEPRAKVCPMADEHAESVAEFFRAVWDPNASAEKVLQGRKRETESNPFSRGQPPPAVLFLSEGRVLGYCGSIPIAVWIGGKEQNADWVKGLMVLPEYRNGPIGFLLLKELLRRLDRPLSLVVSGAARRLLGALGMTDLGLIPNSVRLLNASAVLKKLDLQAMGISGRASGIARSVSLTKRLKMSPILGVCLDVGVLLKVKLCSASTRSLEVDTSTKWPDKNELDCLWRGVRTGIAVASVRDSRYMLWRYRNASAYSIVKVRDEDKLQGLAVVRRPQEGGDPRLNGVRLSVLSDLLFSPHRPDVASALFQATERLSRQYNAEAVLCSASHSVVVSLLSRHGYIRVPANMHLMVDNKCKGEGFPCDLSSWWVTRGDANADEVF
jgi:GNAT superfamily N-acetyltransferase